MRKAVLASLLTLGVITGVVASGSVAIAANCSASAGPVEVACDSPNGVCGAAAYSGPQGHGAGCFSADYKNEQPPA